MRHGKRLHYLSMVAVALVVVGGIYFLLSTAPETIVRNRMLVIPGGWQRFLGAFGLAVGGVAALAYLYGLATRPLRAGRYALTMGTHVFMWVVILLVLYPVVYLVAVSFNENNTLATALPRDGNVIVRAGVVPDPGRVSTVQYTKVLQEFHVEW
ncbi:MAG TPA: sugar ABC transporter permease, partial [Trueperaceae bacterium]|nr:sugar ABC transporter permease [Trueperaceae bacterium]